MNPADILKAIAWLSIILAAGITLLAVLSRANDPVDQADEHELF